MTLNLAVVYWLFDASCVDPERHGYVGVTADLPNRLKKHRANERNLEHRILFEGPEHDCFALEALMRPQKAIGWNKASGGRCPPRSAIIRQKMKEAALRRYADPDERRKMSEIQMGRKVTWGAKVSASKRGISTATDATRAKMSAARKGRPLGPPSAQHRANLSAAKKGMKMPWVAESNRRRAKPEEMSP